MGAIGLIFQPTYDWRIESGLAVLYQRCKTPWRYNLRNLQMALQSAWEQQVRMFEAGIALMSANRELSHIDAGGTKQ